MSFTIFIWLAFYTITGLVLSGIFFGLSLMIDTLDFNILAVLIISGVITICYFVYEWYENL